MFVHFVYRNPNFVFKLADQDIVYNLVKDLGVTLTPDIKHTDE